MITSISNLSWTLLLILSAFADIQEDDDVLELTDDNFNDVLNSHPNVLVAFYAPWCSHCKELAPEYLKAAKLVREIEADAILAKVDATTQSSLATKYNIEGYPTLILFKGEKQVTYMGGPTAQDIIAWLKKKLGSSIAKLQSLEEYYDLTNKHGIYVIVLDKDVLSSGFNVVASVSDNSDLPFYHCNISSILEKYGVSKETKVILMRNFDEPSLVYDGLLNFEDLSKFIEVKSVPFIIEFADDAASSIFGGEIKKNFIFFTSKSDKQYNVYKEMLKVVIANHRALCQVIIVDCDVESHSRILEFFGIKKCDRPQYSYFEYLDDIIKYKPEGADISTQSMEKFLIDALEGRIKPFYNSEDISDDWDKRPVKILVSKNFNQVTQDRTKSVFVLMYSPSCGHCQQILPFWEKLADEFKDDSDIMLAKLNAAANELPDLKLEGFPTIKLFPKDSEEAIDHSSVRTYDGLKTILEQYAKKPKVSESRDSEEELATKKSKKAEKSEKVDSKKAKVEL